MPNFVQKNRLSIGPLASDLKQEFHIFTILVDVSKGTMVKFGVRVWTWGTLSAPNFVKIAILAS